MSPLAGLTTTTKRSNDFTPSMQQPASASTFAPGHNSSFTPSMQLASSQMQAASPTVNLSEIAALFKSMKAELAPQEAIPTDELVGLQTRLAALHTADLLSDDELFAIEDLIADFSDLRTTMLPQVITIELANSGDNFSLVAKLLKVVSVSNTFRSDAAFARQLKRKYC
jgi:hypothetical protein